jgi:hypothetical protein
MCLVAQCCSPLFQININSNNKNVKINNKIVVDYESITGIRKGGI